LKFFIDANIAPHLARGLAALSKPQSIEVVHLHDKFPASTKDEVWLKELGKEKSWTIVSGDYRIATNPVVREAWKEAGLTTFFLQKGWTNIKFWEQSWKLVRWWPTIIDTARTIQPPKTFWVPLAGNKLKLFDH